MPVHVCMLRWITCCLQNHGLQTQSHVQQAELQHCAQPGLWRELRPSDTACWLSLMPRSMQALQAGLRGKQMGLFNTALRHPCACCSCTVALLSAGDSGRHQTVMEGKDFRKAVTREDGSVDKRKFEELWPHLRVLARCNPTDKLIIVKGESWLARHLRQPCTQAESLPSSPCPVTHVSSRVGCNALTSQLEHTWLHRPSQGRLLSKL